MKSRRAKRSQSKKAVALTYKKDQHDAPIVSAKGKGMVAQSILEAATAHGVPIQEDASLVEILSALELQQQIPAELYQLVAEVLSFIYETDRKARDDLVPCRRESVE